MEVEKVIVITSNGLIVECKLTPQTIKKLKTKNLVYIKKSGGKK